MSKRLNSIVARACAILPARCRYARAVIRGNQAWSGADLRGAARRWGSGYARQRSVARAALFDAGGCIVALRRTGGLVTACYVGMDDAGNALYETDAGVISSVNLRGCLK